MALVAAVLVLAMALLVLPWHAPALQLVPWIRTAGPPGVLVYGIAYAVGIVCLVPGTLLTAGAGFAYGPVLGTLLALPASLLGASVAFHLGRSVVRGKLERRLASWPRLAALDATLARHGLRGVLLVRLSPVFPYGISNYLLGASRVSYRDFAAGTLLGILPSTLRTAWLGATTAAIGHLMRHDRPVDTWSLVLTGLGLLATLVVLAVVVRSGRRALALPTHSGPGGDAARARSMRRSGTSHIRATST